MKVREFEELRELSAPARLYAEGDIAAHCWPQALQMLELWHQKRGGRVAPARPDLSALDLGDMMPWMSFCDLSWDPFGLRVRMIGTRFVAAIGFDPTGTSVGDVPKADMIVRRSEWVARYLTPLLVIDLPLVWSQKDFKRYDTLVLPFSDNGVSANMVTFLNLFHV